MLFKEGNIRSHGFEVDKSSNKVPICMNICVCNACIILQFVSRVWMDCDRL